MRIVNSVIFFAIICYSFVAQAGSSNLELYKKFILLNRDGGILVKDDFLKSIQGLNINKYSAKKLNFDYVYWQCFKREQISLSLIDTGYQADEMNGKDTVGRLKINVSDSMHWYHQYEMRSNWPVADVQTRFIHWRKLMEGQSIVCLAGRFVDKQLVDEYGQSKVVYSWVFEALKTKKGMDSYF